MCRKLKKQNMTRKKKTIGCSQSAIDRVQFLRCEYWKKVKNIDQENLVILDKMGVLLGWNELMHVQDMVVEYMI